MPISVTKPTNHEIQKCVARFADLNRCSEGLPDMVLPESKRTFLNVLGFEQPKADGQYSPFGDKARALITHVRAGFGIAYVAAEPGKGVLMHTHDTVETFIVMKGRWKIELEGQEGTQAVLLGPLDFIACPIGSQRRFECVEPAEGEREGLLLGIIGGDAPAAEYSPDGVKRLVDAGVFEAGMIAA
jgi:quercetin dioxygenase-like cupin family protein